MPHVELKIITSDNLKLYGQSWKPEGAPGAVVCLVHGMGEHSSRYDHLANAFNGNGYAMTAFDLRGHGRSEGKRGHVPTFGTLLDDVFQALETTKKHFPGLPLFLYGHSLGGNLVIHYVLKNNPELAGVIATAPLLRLAEAPPAWKTSMLKLLTTLHIRCSISNGLDDNALSRDLNVVRTYRNDPLTHRRITPAMATGMLAAGEWNIEHAPEFPCPLLLMHGDADRITSAAATQEFASRAGDRCTLRIWEGFFHELHNEPGKQEVLASILDWMEKA